TELWLKSAHRLSPTMKDINLKALAEGYTAALVRELIPYHLTLVDHPPCDQKKYRFLTGNHALALGLVSAALISQRKLFFGGYPITPASTILHTLANIQQSDIITYQAEDEIAAIGAAIGAAYGGHLGAVATSGPGFTLMTEFISLAVTAELPLVVIDVQRAGPSTGMPTKTSQGDLFLALFGRNDSSPVVVLAAYSPGDCFDKAYLAAKIAMTRNCVVIVLSDAYLAGSHEVTGVRQAQELPAISIPPHPSQHMTPENFWASQGPYTRDQKTGSRPWLTPGVVGYEHTIGGLEKTDVTGHISYDGDNHQVMMNQRHEKIQKTQDMLPPLLSDGYPQAQTLVISWGSTYGAIKHFVRTRRLSCQPEERFFHIHLESLCPLQKKLPDYLKQRKHILVIESNFGQATSVLRDHYPEFTFAAITKNDGKPWSEQELKDRLTPYLSP
ncbi:MAG: thiamine pyrophosphate-binding protein, partial [Proteobacteria bacterium]|nr:thiamine pyrophosphate-binding protein [Pseudomonadota bacterium]